MPNYGKVEPCPVCGKVTKMMPTHKYQAHDIDSKSKSKWHKKGVITRRKNWEALPIIDSLRGVRVRHNFRDKEYLRKFCIDNELWRFSHRKYEFDVYNRTLNTDIIVMRSTWEIAWANFFQESGIPFEYETYSFDTPAGKYTPDFYLQNGNIYIEVKGRFTRTSKIKVRWVQNQGVKLLVVGNIKWSGQLENFRKQYLWL